MKEYLLCLGAGWQQIESIAALRSDGHKVLAIDKNPNAVGFKQADEFLVADINNPYLIFQAIKKKSLLCNCVIAPINDIGQLTASILGYMMNIPSPSVVSGMLTNSKSLVRMRLDGISANSYFQPSYETFHKDSTALNSIFLNDHTKKIVLKPNSSSGSRGVSVVDIEGRNVNNDCIEKLKHDAVHFSRDDLGIAECFIEGIEYSIESFSALPRKHKTLVISERMMLGGCSAVGMKTIAYDDPLYSALEECAKSLLASIGYFQGPSHIEVKVFQGKIYPIDVGLRGGGYWVADRIVRDVLGINLSVLTAREMLGQSPDFSIKDKASRALIYLNESLKDPDFESEIKDGFYLKDFLALEPIQYAGSNVADGSRTGIQYWEKKHELI